MKLVMPSWIWKSVDRAWLACTERDWVVGKGLSSQRDSIVKSLVIEISLIF